MRQFSPRWKTRSNRLMQIRAFSLFDVLLVAGLLCLLIFLFGPSRCCYAPERAKVSRVKADMRSLATGLESYYTDHKAYPSWSIENSTNANLTFDSSRKRHSRQPTFLHLTNPTSKFISLTTPVPYVSSYSYDPYLSPPTVFSYYSTFDAEEPAGNGWIMWSPGPDATFDLSIDTIADIYDPKQSVPSSKLIELTYDPTNGTKSRGDVWRAKQ